MASQSEINLDEITAAATAAEGYLRMSSDLKGTIRPTTVVDNLESRRKDILQVFGRGSHQAIDATSLQPSTSKGRYEDPEARQQLISRLLEEQRGLKKNAQDEPPSVSASSSETGIKRLHEQSGYERSKDYSADDARDVLFFASDLHEETNDPSSDEAEAFRRLTDYTLQNTNSSIREYTGTHPFESHDDSIAQTIQMTTLRPPSLRPSSAPPRTTKKSDLGATLKRPIARTDKAAADSQSKSYTSNSTTKSQQQVATRPVFKPERIAQMNKHHEESLRDRERAKMEFEKIELMNCTFRPKICRGTETIIKSKAQLTNEMDDTVAAMGGGDVEGVAGVNRDSIKVITAAELGERLHAEAAERVAHKRWLEQSVQEARLSQYTFQPAINPATSAISDSLDYQPIYERVAELQKLKNKRLFELRQSVEAAEAEVNTFHPKIDGRSRRLAQQRWRERNGGGSGGEQHLNQSVEPHGLHGPTDSEIAVAVAVAAGLRVSVGAHQEGEESDTEEIDPLNAGASSTVAVPDVAERLIQEGRLIAMRKQRLKWQHDRAEAEAMTPVKPSKGTEAIAKTSAQVSAGFEERQEMHKVKAQAKDLQRLQDEQREKKSMFKPHISKETYSILKEKRPELLEESAEEKVKRLAVQDVKEIEQRRQERRKELYDSIPFKPEIDPLSKLLGRPSSIDELVENHRGKKALDLAKKRVEEEHNRIHSFKPQINDYSPRSQAAENALYAADFAPFGWADVGDDVFPSSYRNHGHHDPSGCLVGTAPSFGIVDVFSGRQSALQQQQEQHSKSAEFNRRNSFVTRGPHATINLREPEKMAREIRLKMKEKEQKRREHLITKEIQELQECTFQPKIPKPPSVLAGAGGRNSSEKLGKPVIVRGLGRHLELQHLSAQQRSLKQTREKDAFRVKNAEKFKRPEDGTTIVKPFKFATEQRLQTARQ